jgi:salicylate hydroxylase
LNGEDVRDRWHNALKDLDDDVDINPDEVKIKVSQVKSRDILEVAKAFQNRWLYPFDAEADTLQRWQDVSAKVAKELQDGKVLPLFGTTAELYALEAH